MYHIVPSHVDGAEPYAASFKAETFGHDGVQIYLVTVAKINGRP